MSDNDKDTVAPKAWADVRDVIGLVGLALIGGGAWMVYPPAGLICPGAIMTAVAIFGVRS
jgi:hypothetical protein